MIEIIKTLVATGRTKMFVALGAIAALYHLSTTNQLGWEAMVGIVAVTAMFLFFRRGQETDEVTFKRLHPDKVKP